MGLPVSLIGVFLIVATEPGAKLSIGSMEGNIFAIGTALSWAVYTILLQPLLTRYSVARISFWVVLLGLAALIGPAVATLSVTRVLNEPWWDWLLVLSSGLGAIFFTNFLWYLGTYRLGPARGSLYSFLQPFLGVFMAMIILGDTANIVEVVGGAIVIVGIILARRARGEKAAIFDVIGDAPIDPAVPG